MRTCSLLLVSLLLGFWPAANPAGLLFAAPTLMRSSEATGDRPPVAARRQHTVLLGRAPGTPARGSDGARKMDPPVLWRDDLFWLRDDARTNEEVLRHVEAENAYAQSQTAHLACAQKRLFETMRSRMQESDAEVPTGLGHYFYYKRMQEGRSFQLHCRAKTQEKDGEEVLLDENRIPGASGSDTCCVLQGTPSCDDALFAYSVDLNGSERYSIHVQRLRGEQGDERHDALGQEARPVDTVQGTSGQFVWSTSSVGGENTRSSAPKRVAAAHAVHDSLSLSLSLALALALSLSLSLL